MKKILVLLIMACCFCSCNETVRRSFPSTKGHFKGYAFVYSFEEGNDEAERVGYFPVYRKGEDLIIFVDEDETESRTLNELSNSTTLPGVPMTFGYTYGSHYYVSKNISY